MDNRKISLCIPVFNRYNLLLESFEQVKNNSRISEICIYNDGSDEYYTQKIVDYAQNESKIRLLGNSNKGVHFAKKMAVSMARNEFVILFDSDNVLTPYYLDVLYKIPNWEKGVWYAPTFAYPHFKYQGFNNILLDKSNIKDWCDKKFPGMSGFDTFGNTNNMFINRDEYLKCWKDRLNVSGEDSLWMAYCWLEQGNRILGLENLSYFHRVHDNTIGEQSGNYNSDKNAGYKIEQVMSLLRQL